MQLDGPESSPWGASPLNQWPLTPPDSWKSSVGALLVLSAALFVADVANRHCVIKDCHPDRGEVICYSNCRVSTQIANGKSYYRFQRLRLRCCSPGAFLWPSGAAATAVLCVKQTALDENGRKKARELEDEENERKRTRGEKREETRGATPD